MHHYRMNFYSYLRDNEPSMRAFARRAGVAHTTITRHLRGEVLVSKSMLGRIAQATNGKVSEQEVLTSFGAARVAEPAAA